MLGRTERSARSGQFNASKQLQMISWLRLCFQGTGTFRSFPAEGAHGTAGGGGGHCAKKRAMHAVPDGSSRWRRPQPWSSVTVRGSRREEMHRDLRVRKSRVKHPPGGVVSLRVVVSIPQCRRSPLPSVHVDLVRPSAERDIARMRAASKISPITPRPYSGVPSAMPPSALAC